MSASLFGLPPELRFQIYECFFSDHQRIRGKSQPSNAHLRLLHTCRTIQDEAGTLLRRYVSLIHEHQIKAFLDHAGLSLVSQIEWADVANDGRISQSADNDQEDTPLSKLHIALARMTALRRLRVFQCSQGLPMDLQTTVNLHRSRRMGLHFERAIFPKNAPELTYYELYLSADTRVDLFHVISPSTLVALRLSGEIYPHVGNCESVTRMPALRHLVLHGTTGTYFDRHSFEECFPDARIETFIYALVHRLGFEIRNYHLESLVRAHGMRLRKLVLLGCSRLSSAVITECLENLPRLEYFALHLVTVDELRSNFIRAIPQTLTVLKLQVINAWYAVALMAEERDLCEAIEGGVLLRERPLEHVAVCFRNKLMTEDGRQDRWMGIAEDRKFQLEIGPWEHQMVEDI